MLLKKIFKNIPKKNCYLEESCSLRVPSSPERRKNSKLAQDKVFSYWNKFKTPEEIAVPDKISECLKTPDYYIARRMSIYRLFSAFGAPEPDTWGSTDLVQTIMKLLYIHYGSKNDGVIKVLTVCLNAIKNIIEYDPKACYKNMGRPKKIVELSDTAQLVYDTIENTST